MLVGLDLQVLTRIKQYKDDLLASCLTFILSLPQEIVEAEIKAIVPALKVGGSGDILSSSSYMILIMLQVLKEYFTKRTRFTFFDIFVRW